MQKEEWDLIWGVECDTKYCVSTMGRIMNEETNMIMKQSTNSSGYKVVNLMHDGKAKTYKVHRLVALTFIANPENKSCVDHISGDKTNNNLKNLRWATKSENGMNKPAKGYYKMTNGKYKAYIMLHGVQQHLGCYNTVTEAKAVREKAAKEQFGPYYCCH